ncbi:T9SS type A sorting domain-containing protein [Sungkyunkwania multivorans]|uniref:T9SS type A sorting domain-containing protein n=1 Tax=Sungkyunkwania multivorans TaxID=1173618 RepID=A0ABW3CW99_9FLAO
MKKLLPFIFCLVFGTTISYGQTVLSPGDIAIFWGQADTPDDFAFVTFVDLAPGTIIYFADAGIVPGGTFDPAGSTEGATVYTAPAGGLPANSIVQFVSGAADFSPLVGDSLITGGFAISTAGDQVIAFQDADGDNINPASNPTFIFALNLGSTGFTGDDSLSTTQTNLPAGLSDTGLPRTALAVGSGPGVSDEFDNAVYTGTYTFASTMDAKIALTDPANYYGSNPNPPGLDATYDAAVAAIPASLSGAVLSIEDVALRNSIKTYPNPTNGEIFIKNDENKLLTNAQIVDISGRVIKSYDLRNADVEERLDLSGLTTGIYVLRVNAENASFSEKFVIE